jgi:hypothetical protein
VKPGTLFGSILFFLVSLFAVGQNGPVPGVDWVSFHKKSDQFWAIRSRLSLHDVRSLRLAAGIKDDEPSDSIEMMDGKTLGRDQVLLVTATNSGQCLDVTVYKPGWTKFAKLWSTASTPENKAFCRPPACHAPRAWATGKGVVTVTLAKAGPGADATCDTDEILTYRWKNSTYELMSDRTVAGRCDFHTYLRAMNEALTQIQAPGDTIAMVVVASPFAEKYAIAIRRTPDGSSVYHFQIPRGSSNGGITDGQPPSQCIESAKVKLTELETVPLTSVQVQQFVSALRDIDPRTDRCPRTATGVCAFFFDASEFLVWLPNGTQVRLTRVDGSKRFFSENPALSQWIESLLESTKMAENKTPGVYR